MTTNHRKKGGDLKAEKPKRGAPKRKYKSGERILPGGLFERQWKWIKKEANHSGQDGAQYLRWLVDLHIGQVEASRSEPVATQEEDHEFETLTSEK